MISRYLMIFSWLTAWPLLAQPQTMPAPATPVSATAQLPAPAKQADDTQQADSTPQSAAEQTLPAQAFTEQAFTKQESGHTGWLPPARVDLATVLKLAREASPRLALQRQQVAIAQAERRTAGAYPNPSVSFGHANQPGAVTNFEGRQSAEWSVEQPVLLPGQHSSRVRAADLRVDAARAWLSASAGELAAEAGAGYVALLAAQQKQALLSDSLQELQQLRDVVAARHQHGVASQYDLLRFDLELTAWRTQVAEAVAELSDRQSQLAALLGVPDWRPLGQVSELKALSVQAGAQQRAEHPVVAASRRAEAAAQAGVRAAELDRLPNVSVSVGKFWTREPYGKTYSVGVGIEVPLFDSRDGELDKAKAEAESARLERRLSEAQVQADVERYSALVRQRLAALHEYQRQLLPQLPDLQQMAKDAYRLGQSSVAELLDATRASYDTRLSQLELMAGLMEAQLRLQAARGEPIAG